MISDQELVAACRQGSQDAFRRLVDKHWAGVVRTVAPLLDDLDDVEDAAQEAFIRACRRLDELKDPDRLPAWLHAIARNAARKMLRQRRLEQQRLPEHELTPHSTTTASLIAQDQLLSGLPVDPLHLSASPPTPPAMPRLVSSTPE